MSETTDMYPNLNEQQHFIGFIDFMLKGKKV